MEQATNQQIERFLSKHSSWAINEGKLHKTFVFKNFIKAFDFMTQIAEESEKMNHHPEWCNTYNKVIVNLVTHDAKGISQLDFKLALMMDKLQK